MIESSSVRRSPRLSRRYTNLLSTGELIRSSFPLTYSATSRPSLSGYHVRDVDERSVGSEGSSILDESGQTVPASFDADVEPTATLLVSSVSASSELTAESASGGQHFDTPPQHPDDVPQHLYGEGGLQANWGWVRVRGRSQVVVLVMSPGVLLLKREW